MLSRLVATKVAILNRTITTFPRSCDKKYFSQAIKYTDTHEWLYYQWDCTKMGLSKKAIEEMGELVYIDYSCKKGDVIKENKELVTIESVKTVEPINAPYDCVVLGINDKLTDISMLEKLCNDPECTETSWIVKIDKIP